MIGRLHERGGLPALAIGGLLARAAEVSGGQHLQPSQCDFIGPYPSMPVWGSSLGALGPDTSLRLSPMIDRSSPLPAPSPPDIRALPPGHTDFARCGPYDTGA